MQYFDKCLNPIRVPVSKGKFMLVPCGKCKSCMIKKSSYNSLQCSLEEVSNRFCLFVTLTYSQDYVPTLKIVVTENDVQYVNQ